MKKALAILFCFVYLLSSAGVHINLHYCSGKIKSVSFLHSDEADCCGGKMKKKDCCKEKSLSIQVKDNQNSSAKQLLVKPTQVSKDIIRVTDIHLRCLKLIEPSLLVYSEPPDILQGKLFLSNRILRI